MAVTVAPTLPASSVSRDAVGQGAVGQRREVDARDDLCSVVEVITPVLATGVPPPLLATE